jgi:hypothetical protein
MLLIEFKKFKNKNYKTKSETKKKTKNIKND